MMLCFLPNGHWAEKIEVSSVPIYCITEGKAGLTKAKDETALEIRKKGIL